MNNTTTGDCGYCFQVLFNLAAIDSNDVSLIRIVSRTTVLGGKQSTLEKSDGPSAPSIVRPSGSLIAVADCPGLFASSATPDPTAFPMSYHAHFILSAHDSAQSMAVLAKISYDINLDKKAIDDPSPSMVFNVTDQQIF